MCIRDRSGIERLEPALVSDSIAAYCQQLRSWNERPVLFFDGTASRSLQSIYVERELSEERGEEAPAMGEAACREHQRTTLPELIEEHAARTGGPGGAWLVLGAPGSGKTTLLRHLAADMAARYEEDDDAPLPVLLSLAHLAAKRRSPFELAEEDLEGRAPGLSAELAASAQGSRLWLLLDGLDEVHGHDLDELAFLLTSFSRLYPGVPVVITSRDEGRVDLGLALEPLRLLDLERPQELLDRWLHGWGAAVWASIERHPTLQTLARNPLMLTLMAKLAEDGSELPAFRGELYAQAVTLLLERGTDRSGRGVADPDAAADLLPPLALRLQRDGGESWPRPLLARHLRRCCQVPEVLADLKIAWDSPSAFLDDLGAQSGLLAPRRGPRQPWEFVHRSLREYLAARAWAESEQPEEYLELIAELSGRMREDCESTDEVIGRWGETLTMLAGLLEDSGSCRSLLEALREFPGRLAVRALSEASALSKEDALEFLLATSRWDGEDLLELVRGWLAVGVPPAELETVLLSRIGPDLELETAGRFLYAMEEVAAKVDLDSFFESWGRPRPAGGPAAIGIEMRRIPEGRFTMGSPSGYGMYADRERSVHSVALSSFEMASCPVTEGQLAQLVGGAPRSNADHPAVQVSWYGARLFCRWLGATLPTEAQWEYACRAGSTTHYWSGDTEEDLACVGWYVGNSRSSIHCVAEKPASPWGLYDMHGNVEEWCSDWFGSYDLSVAQGTGQRNVAAAKSRVYRGGYFNLPAGFARSACRLGGPPTERHPWLGFRPARLGPES